LVRSQVPKYVTIKILLEARWEREMRRGDRLPSEAELCAAFSVSRATVQQALQLFEREGVIRRDQGRGTFYVGPSEGRTEQEPSRLLEATIRGREGNEIRVLRKGVEMPPARVAARLGLAREDRVVALERLGLVEGAPIVFIYSFLPLAVGMRLLEPEDQLRQMSLAAVLNDAHGCGIDRVQQVISARLADPRFAAELGVDVGVPVLEGERTYYARDDDPVLCTVSYYWGDRHNFTMSVKDWR
jgi:GntR family transcriptional regulator